MLQNIFTSYNHSPEVQEFLLDSFLSWEKNEWYRYFTKENIKIDFENRILTIIEDYSQKTLWAHNFRKRWDIDWEFLTNSIFLDCVLFFIMTSNVLVPCFSC